MTTYPRATVKRQDFLTPYRGIGADGQPEWRFTYSWEGNVFASPDDVPNRPIARLVSEDFDDAVHAAHREVAHFRKTEAA
ncbi:hypothetical protein ACXYTP_25330 [Tsukamurella ocularis]